MKHLITCLVIGMFFINAKAQVRIGNPGPIFPGSLLQLESNNKGLRMPRVVLTNTTTWAPLQGLGTDTAAAGMAVYNTNAAIASTNASYPANGIGEYTWDGTGWVNKNSSNTQSSLVLFSARNTSQQPATQSSYVVVDFASKAYDKNNNLNLTTNSFTVPANAGGFYQINASLVTSSQSAGQGGYLGLFVNGALNRYILIANAAAGAGIAGNGTIAVQLNAGAVVTIRYLANTASQEFDVQADVYQMSR